MSNYVEVLPDQDTSDLDATLLFERGQMRPWNAKTLQMIDPSLLRLWCHKNARYGLVTIELIEWLRGFVIPGATIEVAAGMGDLGFNLGIMMTDSYCQQKPEMQLYYGTIGVPRTNPPHNVRELDANSAVEKYRPKVVIASWLTQAFEDGDEDKKIGSSIYGAEERHIIGRCDTYIHIGNANVHGDKRALELPHEEYRFPWLVSRAQDQSKNCIYVWRKQ